MALSSPRDTSGILPNIDEEISTISGPFSIFIAAASTSPTSNVRNAAPSRSMSIQTAQLQHPDQANRVETPPMISNGCPSYFAFLWGYAARRRMILQHKLNNPFAKLLISHICVYWGGYYTRSFCYQHIYTSFVCAHYFLYFVLTFIHFNLYLHVII